MKPPILENLPEADQIVVTFVYNSSLIHNLAHSYQENATWTNIDIKY